MRSIELDATKWKTVDDFYDALLASIGAPKWHGKSPDALIDSMVWGGINSVDPPYTIKITGLSKLPKDILDHIETAKQAIAEGRADYRNARGGDVQVAVETES
jgi:RNAse (barnase) inhibitor barstar